MIDVGDGKLAVRGSTSSGCKGPKAIAVSTGCDNSSCARYGTLEDYSCRLAPAGSMPWFSSMHADCGARELALASTETKRP
jgi:hypothetical protein